VLDSRVLEERTREYYLDLLRLHILPVFGDVEIGDLAQNPGTVESWNAALKRKHPSTAAKAYRLLCMIFNAAIRNEDIVKNPCRVQGAGKENAARRPIATKAEVDVLAGSLPGRFRCIVLLATWTALRRGELFGLRRGDLEVMLRGTVSVEQTLQQLRDGTLVTKGPKSRAGQRTIAIPQNILGDLRQHLETYVEPQPDALVFTGEKGGPLRPHVWQKHWSRARLVAGRPELHLHDLRHTGLTWAAATGASMAELMARGGHDDMRSALRYQAATDDRDRVIAEALADFVQPAEVVPINRDQDHR
jgi:integrase